MTQATEHRVIQVSNVAATVNLEQLQQFFGHVGAVEECRLYPTTEQTLENGTRICYVKFRDLWSVGVAMHLSNTPFMDRPLLIYPMCFSEVPDEDYAVNQLAPGAPVSSAAEEPPAEAGTKKLTNELSVNAAGAQIINTIDPSLALKGAPNYPALPAGLTEENIAEIRRTIYVGNLDPNLTNEMVLKFFSQCGEIKYVRMGGEAAATMKHALVEFSDPTSVGNAFQFNGTLLGTRAMVVSHSSTAIIKPKCVDGKNGDDSQSGRNSSISKARSRSKSKEKTRRRSRSTSRKRRTSPRRSRSRSRNKTKRSRSRERKRSRDRRRSRSKRRETSRTRRRSRDRKRSKDRKDKSPTSSKLLEKSDVAGPMTPPEETNVESRTRSSNENTSKQRNDIQTNGKSDRKDDSKSKRKSRSRSRDRRRRSRSRDRRRRSNSLRRKKKSRSRSRERRRGRSKSRSKSTEKRRRSRSVEKRRKKSRSVTPEKSSKDRRDRRRSRTPEKKNSLPPPPRDYDEEERLSGDPHNPAAVAASIIAPLAPMGPALPPPPPIANDAEDMDLSD